MKIIYLLPLVLLLSSPFLSAKQIIGIYEKVALPTEGLVLKAKIDSGAKNTSLHALNIQLFQQNGKQWVSFDTVNGNDEKISLSAPVHRIAKVKRHNALSQKRPVIITGVCLANFLRNVEVNLIDRGRLNYPLLIGRTYLEGTFLIDVSLRYTTQPNC
jgi:hypothetical protein